MNVLHLIAWLWFNGYMLAFALGVVCALQFHIVQHARQIRRNSETIRRHMEGRART